MLTHERMVTLVDEMRETARGFIRRLAREEAPHVAVEEVEALARALGDISIDEARAVLAQLEREATGEAPA